MKVLACRPQWYRKLKYTQIPIPYWYQKMWNPHYPNGTRKRNHQSNTDPTIQIHKLPRDSIFLSQGSRLLSKTRDTSRKRSSPVDSLGKFCSYYPMKGTHNTCSLHSQWIRNFPCRLVFHHYIAHWLLKRNHPTLLFSNCMLGLNQQWNNSETENS